MDIQRVAKTIQLQHHSAQDGCVAWAQDNDERRGLPGMLNTRAQADRNAAYLADEM